VLLACPEAGTACAHQQLLGSTAGEDTVVTAAVTGKPVRAIRNRLVDELAGVPPLPYPQLHTWTAELRRAAAEAGRSDLMGMWAGQTAAMASEQPAGELVAQLVDAAMRILRR
jgi:nitronate monooxygenase